MKYISISFLFCILLLNNSCKTREKLIYLQDSVNQDTIKLPDFNFTFQKGDIVEINVSSIDLEAAKPFKVNDEPTSVQSSYSAGNPSLKGYLIDQNGEINFPVVGKIKLVDLTKDQASNLILKEVKNYINDPIISIRLTNFKITVLGSVNHPGTFAIPNERISIFEAIGLTGDLKITGNRKNVLLVRNENGINKKYRIDLTSNDILNSKVFFLNQNDIVYVEPNFNERYSSTNVKVFSGFLGTFISVIFTILYISLK